MSILGIIFIPYYVAVAFNGVPNYPIIPVWSLGFILLLVTVVLLWSLIILFGNGISKWIKGTINWIKHG